MQFVSNQGVEVVVLNALRDGILQDVTLKLFKSPITVSRLTTLADLDSVQADFSGYDPVPVTVSDPAVNANGQTLLYLTAPSFRANASDDTNMIYGWYLFDTVGAQLVAAGSFQNGPVSMSSNLSILDVYLTWFGSYTGNAEIAIN